MIEKTLQTLIPANDDPLYKAARYSLQGGKRLRPRLTLAVTNTYSVPPSHALVPACALELIHTYSLIHDDLPCMDDDTLRRGRPTLHLQTTEALAVLTGDYLLTTAFEHLAKAPHLTSSTKIELISLLSARSGSEGMIGGQVLDMTKSGDIKSMHLKKTGALIMCALEFGALIARQDPNPFKEIGAHLGLAFQLVDDLLDGDGAARKEPTDQLEAKAKAHHEKARELASELPGGAPELCDLATQMVYRSV